VTTLVALHAHPDDECLMQSGTLAKAVDAGHRVVVVYATGGELGEVPEGLLAPGEALADRRRVEAARSAAAIGVHRVVWLGYRDSGMEGTPGNDDPACFARADLDAAAQRVADVLRDERADVLTIYDRRGTYGHPDHVQVHRVGARAAELAGTPNVLELTWSSDKIRAMLDQAIAAGALDPADLPSDDFELGMPDAVITTRVDVEPWLDRKRASMRAHESQIGDTGMFLAMEPEAFAHALGTEFYIRRGVPAGHHDDDVFAGVASAGAPAV
jgi:LmbE family N-acetylglucosaminyl deacetylase